MKVLHNSFKENANLAIPCENASIKPSNRNWAAIRYINNINNPSEQMIKNK